MLAPLKVAADVARKKVAEVLVAAGVESVATKHGSITLRRQTTTNWEALARHILTKPVIDALLATKQFESVSEPYVQALPSWAGAKK